MSPLTLVLFLVLTAVVSIHGQSAPVPKTSFFRSIGDPDAPVVLEGFLDFQCPDCKAAWPVLKQVMAHYGPSKLRFFFQPFPLPYHHNAFFAAEASFVTVELTGNVSTFWNLTEILFQMQDYWGDTGTENMTSTQVISLLGDYAVKCCGVDKKQFIAKMGWTSEYNLNARDMWKFGASQGMYGTPQFKVNGVFVPEASSGWQLQQWVTFLDPLF
eukprot:CAMPEP_0174251512 /NCGR_PEP_ID=MMETSP0439-20130205/1312_1 /TAXON_ID=0 /ORGANISM="Stereomyxa ramosa, Strain Chinc5" /LENGTH=213 /DNA_ID=CAMNT_0015331843 /DNA_START=39 /DNA_END=680 /DNA_ORIENTATION=-